MMGIKEDRQLQIQDNQVKMETGDCYFAGRKQRLFSDILVELCKTFLFFLRQ